MYVAVYIGEYVGKYVVYCTCKSAGHGQMQMGCRSMM